MRYDKAKRKTCEVIHWAIAILVILCIASAIASILAGVLVAKPGILALDFKTAKCIVKSIRYVTQETCDCSGFHSEDTSCRSEFPCYQIVVGYGDAIKYNSTEMFDKEAMLHESETDFASKFSRCSFHYCHQDYQQNDLQVQSFTNKYGKKGHVFSCLHNPNNPEQVIVFRRYNATHILLVLIIPPAAFLLCLIILVCLCVVKGWTVKQKKSRRPIENPFAAPRHYLGRDMPAFEPDEAVDSMTKLPDPFESINNMFSSETGERNHHMNDRMVNSDQDHPMEDNKQGQLSDVVPQSVQMSTAM